MIQSNISNYDMHQSNFESDYLSNTEIGASLDTDLILENESTEDNQITSNETEPDSFALEANSLTEGEGLDFVFNFDDNVPQEIRDKIGKAGEAWSAVISDDVTVQINVAYEFDIDGFANANSETTEVAYSTLRQALSDNATSKTDKTAIANLPESETLNLLINNTKEIQGSDDVYLDDDGSANNSTIEINTANAKALGLDAGENTVDATITFEQAVNWDYDASDGLDGIDFESIAIHEIGHALGFSASVDDLDEVAGLNLKQLIASENVDIEDIAEALAVEVESIEDILATFGIENIKEIDPESFIKSIEDTPTEALLESIQPDQFASENFYLPNTMDLFRYTDLSTDLGVSDFTVGKRDKYFSIDGGVTEIAPFSTGQFLGDGGQISHWEDDLGLGVMDPFYDFEAGEIGSISSNDLQLLDAIGWNTIVV